VLFYSQTKINILKALLFMSAEKARERQRRRDGCPLRKPLCHVELTLSVQEWGGGMGAGYCIHWAGNLLPRTKILLCLLSTIRGGKIDLAV
jgi:hypothetical protein